MKDPDAQAVNRAPGPQPHGSLGEALRTRRRAMGWTLERLAAAVECSTGYLSAIETGRKGPPADAVLLRLEATLGFSTGDLIALARWARTPGVVRRELASERAKRRDAERVADRLAAILSGGGLGAAGGSVLDEAYRSGELAALIGRLSGEGAGGTGDRAGERPGGRSIEGPEGARTGNTAAIELPLEVPLINRVAAGYPAEFTDLGYPARVADDYVRCPDLRDPDAFAARVVGDSMQPDYREGDIVVFSPARPAVSGQDCFVRIEPDHESTFKRVYFGEEAGGEGLIRLQPLNSRYPPRVLEREQVAGVYPAVTVMRSIG